MTSLSRSLQTILRINLDGTYKIVLERSATFQHSLLSHTCLSACSFDGYDTITATCTVTELIQEKNIAKLVTVCTNQNGVAVVEGQATVMPPKE